VSAQPAFPSRQGELAHRKRDRFCFLSGCLVTKVGIGDGYRGPSNDFHTAHLDSCTAFRDKAVTEISTSLVRENEGLEMTTPTSVLSRQFFLLLQSIPCW
jgi:hypothetical protein